MKFNNREILISASAKIGKNVMIGDNVTIYDNVIIGDNVVISNNVVIGEPLATYYSSIDSYVNPPTTIGEGSLIRSHTIIYAGSSFGKNFNTGHNVTIRERSSFGDNCSVGSYCDIQGDCTVGNYNRFHSYVNIGKFSRLEDYVFIYPFVVLTNDPTPPSNDLMGPTIGSYSQISAGSVLLPNSKVASESLVGANSTVGGEFEPDSFINGSPAKRVGKLSKMPFFNVSGKRHYPWMYNFHRGLPWDQLGYDKWETELKREV